MHVAFRTQDVRTERSRVRVRLAGSGTPVLFLHGVLCDAKVWAPLVSALCNQHLCIVPDMTGYGDSDRPGLHSYAYNEDSWAEDAFDILTALDVPRAHVIGYAEGAHVGVRLSTRAPSTVVSMVALASPRWSDTTARARKAASMPLWGRLALAAWVRSRVARGDIAVGSLADAKGLDIARAMLRAGRDTRTLGASLSTLSAPTLAVLDADAPELARQRVRQELAPTDRVRIAREPANELRRGVLDPGFSTRIASWLSEKSV